MWARECIQYIREVKHFLLQLTKLCAVGISERGFSLESHSYYNANLMWKTVCHVVSLFSLSALKNLLFPNQVVAYISFYSIFSEVDI